MPGQPGSETRRRQHIVHMRMDAAELARLDRLIGSCGWTRAAFLRELVATSGDVHVIDVAPLVAALSRIGGNLNQLARHANITERIDDSAGLCHALGELVACIRQLDELAR